MSPGGRRGSGSGNNGDYRFDGSATSAGAGAGAGVAAGGGHFGFDGEGEGISPVGGRRLSTVVAPHDAALAAVLSAAKPLAADCTEAG